MSNSGILMLDISIIDTNNMDALTNRLNIGQEKMKWKSHFDNHLIAKEVFNMKYKFELWNYDFFAYEEAERHLNDMSERGWDIVGITLEWLPIGVYQRRLQNKKKRYSIVPVEEDDHDFYVACEDAGWHKVRTIRGGLCIFEAQGDFAKPLFSDEMTKYQNLIEVMETNNPVSSFILTLILLLFIFFQDFKTGWGSPGYYVLAGICLMGLVANVVGIKEYLFHKKAAEYAEEGIILVKFLSEVQYCFIWCRGNNLDRAAAVFDSLLYYYLSQHFRNHTYGCNTVCISLRQFYTCSKTF